jgi:hypothetical protein
MPHTEPARKEGPKKVKKKKKKKVKKKSSQFTPLYNTTFDFIKGLWNRKA